MSNPSNKATRRFRLPRIVRFLLFLSIRNEAVREGLLGDLEQEFADVIGRGSSRLVRWITCCTAALALASRFTVNRVSGIRQPHAGWSSGSAQSADKTSQKDSNVKLVTVRSIKRPPRLSPKADWLGDAWKDVRFAFRGLTKSKGFTLVTVFSLALGIGVNTALLSITDTFLDPVPGVTGADRLIEVLTTSRGRDAQEWAYPDFEAVRNADTPIAELAGNKQREATLFTNEGGQSVQAVYVSANYFQVLGVGMYLGRDFFPSEDVGPGLNPIAILSHDMWQNEFGGDPGIVGHTITLNRAPYTVVGVASRDFRGHQPMKMGPYQPDLWVPLTQHPFVAGDRGMVSDRLWRWLEVMGRLHANTTLDEANVALSTIFARLAEEYPETNERRSARAAAFGPIPALGRAMSLAGVAMVFALAGLALLIICGNLAGMGLARSASREREIAVRLALGSGRRRLVRFLMVEAVILALIGGAAGIFLAFVATSPAFLGRLGVVLPPHFDISPSALVLALSIDSGVRSVSGNSVQSAGTGLVAQGRRRRWRATRRPSTSCRRLGTDRTRIFPPGRLRPVPARAWRYGT
ncbi:ABC transporter permease [Gemmatimonadota bacterium]